MTADTQATSGSAVLLPTPETRSRTRREYWTAESKLTGVWRGLELLAAGGGFVLVTAAAFSFHATFSATACLYLLIIVLAALRWGFREATAFSVAAVLSLDYFFTVPLFSLRITYSSDLMALMAFEFAGLVVSRLSAEAQHQASLAKQERNNIEKLYQLARSILLLDSHEPAGEQIACFTLGAIRVDAVALFDFATGKVHTTGAASPELEAFVRNVWIGNRNQDDAQLRASGRILRLGHKGIGAIALCAKELNPLVVDAVTSIAAVALERSQSLEKETRAEAARQSEQLRVAVLDALAHAFKTPLTAIRAASSGLLEAGSLSAPEAELVTLIDEESVRLNDLATRLLRTARLESSPVAVRRAQCDLTEVTRHVVESFAGLLDSRPVRLSLPAEGLTVSANAELIGTALSQLVDNSIKYSWPDSTITISVAGSATGDEVVRPEAVVAVHNMGPAIRAEDRERLFERFYRSPGTEHRAAGTGLGLSITKKVAEAHNGRTWVVSSETSGTTFYLALPVQADLHE